MRPSTPRHAAWLASGTPLRDELLCLRGESLLRAGQPAISRLEAFGTLLAGVSRTGPYAPQALFSGALAREKVGDARGLGSGASASADTIPETPWAQRLAATLSPRNVIQITRSRLGDP